ncbi:MAG: gamma-glutamyl-gamma-aminobutyrate hydrolase family protein [Ignavibacteriales bacterium]|nr:gamma-glutamyl-gamma-aminobutyrate hydrolase family protein [Ignavibacteriales bacterium]
MRLGITDNLRPKPVFENYGKWIHRVDRDVEMVKLSHLRKNAEAVKEMDGLILSGGGDVHPALYGREDAVDQVEEVNEMRDSFEFGVIERALEAEIPILGICRGMQIMNVYLGGSLIVDLPVSGYRSHVERDGIDHRHPLIVVPHTLLETITGKGPKKVSSIHHQAVDRMGKGLMVSAKSDDGVIEAMEWILKDRMPFLLLVQWHPERMQDFDNPCSGNIAEYFLREVARSIKEKREQFSDKETE